MSTQGTSGTLIGKFIPEEVSSRDFASYAKASHMRVCVFIAVLALIPLSGCFTMRLWDSPRDTPAGRVVAAGLEDSHRLLVEIAFASGEREVFRYDLRDSPAPGVVLRDHLPNRALLSPGNVVRLSDAKLEEPGHEMRFKPGTVLHVAVHPPGMIVVSTRDLALEPPVQEEVSGEIEFAMIQDQDVDSHASETWDRVGLTLPAVVLDVVTSPIQLVMCIWILCSGNFH